VTGYCRRNNATNGFVYKKQTGQWIDLLPTQPNGELQPYAINNAGTVVGYRSIRNDVVPREAFIWNEASGFQGLGVMNGPSSGATAISENGIVVGWTGSSPSWTSNNTRGFILNKGNLMIVDPVPNGFSSYPISVSSDGSVGVVGKVQQSPILFASFIFQQGSLTPLKPAPGTDRAWIISMDDHSRISGICTQSSNSVRHAALWQSGQGVLLETRVYPTLTGALETNVGCSLDGVILASARFAGPAQGLIDGAMLLKATHGISGDCTCDGHVNVDDLLLVINAWGPCSDCSTDFDGNDLVDIDDLLTVVTSWSP
jgi:uncharacterized membrane protein